MLNGLLGGLPWTLRLVSAIPGQIKSKLPVYDLTSRRAKFSASKKHIRPLPRSSSEISFSTWRMAHAVKKAECTRRLSATLERITSLGFLLESEQMFDWGSANFRLSEGAISLLDDFSRTSLSGRIAQGVSLLYMEDKGYAFVDRFTAFSKRCGVPVSSTLKGKKGVKLKTPDFVCEKDTESRALVESKGGFVSEGVLADIKSELKYGLDQLAPWGSQFHPAITKKFAVGTFLREVNDANKEPSLIVVVDPDGEPASDAANVPPEAIRQANYASWLRGMGYQSAALRLMGAPESPHGVHSFLVYNVLGTDYALAPSAPLITRIFDHSLGVFDLLAWIKEPSYGLSPMLGWGRLAFIAAGIDLEILQRLGTATAKEHIADLLEIVSGDSVDLGESLNIGGASGSRFADGSFYGAIDLESILHEPVRIIEIEF